MYWSKIPGTEKAKTIEPSEDYVVPFGKGRLVLEADKNYAIKGESISIITYGRGVYWALEAASAYEGKVEIIDLRTLYPLDEELIYESVRNHGKALIVTEEPSNATFALGLAGKFNKIVLNPLMLPLD